MDEPTQLEDGSQWLSMSDVELRSFVERNTWTYAKTMPQCPHEYVVLWKSTSDEEFLRFVMTIRRYGYDEYFYSKRMRYLDVNGWRYWTMGAQIETTWVLNRAQNTQPDRPQLLNKENFPHSTWVPSAKDPLPPQMLARR